jgi:hypothetical protein
MNLVAHCPPDHQGLTSTHTGLWLQEELHFVVLVPVLWIFCVCACLWTSWEAAQEHEVDVI